MRNLVVANYKNQQPPRMPVGEKLRKHPELSVLIATYNRASLLPRAIDSVLMQSFKDFELIVIDDASTDNTAEVVHNYKDDRIRYVRNTKNIGKISGDRAHMRRFVYELMRGNYFVYLCDDDYLLSKTLFKRQISAFEIYPNLSMAIGGQLSHFITDDDSLFGGTYDKPFKFSLDNLKNYFDFFSLESKSRHLQFMTGPNSNKSLFKRSYMTSDEFLEDFANDPISKLIIAGATMYSKEKFINCGGLSGLHGSMWQAGYELLAGPACVGDVVYLNEPAIVTDIRQRNASFQRTQVEHYQDSITSLLQALNIPVKLEKNWKRKIFLKKMIAVTVQNISRAYLRNTITIKQTGKLTLCSEENIAHPVSSKNVLVNYIRYGAIVRLDPTDVALLLSAALPRKIATYFYKFCKSLKKQNA